MIHADNLGSAVRMFSVELGSLIFFPFLLDFFFTILSDHPPVGI
jgi:hypothetical protein